MKLEKIIAISGKPGLYKIVSQTKGGIIVESLQDKKRFPVNSINNVSSLSDIAIYTDEDEKPLKEIFLDIYKKEDGKKSLDHKSAKEDLLSYFSEVLPNYDEERVYSSNIKKVIQWYNSLIDSDFDFNSLEEKEDTEETDKKEK